jgi:zinc-binding alcohol dehydrogenase family protein
MKVVSFRESLPITHPESFLDLTAAMPQPGPRDLLVEIRAIGINPVDTKVRAGRGPGGPGGDLPILGWDAAGVVRAVGAEAGLFHVGDEVFYAGSVDRPGCYAEFQCVDERLAGPKPRQIGFAASAAMPLTTITAWEMLFDRLRVDRTRKGSLLIVGGAGGVGSAAIQLARVLTNMDIIATASRPDTQEWCRQMGAHHVIDHREPLGRQVLALAPAGVDHVLVMTKTGEHYDEIVEAMAPQSSLALIENPTRPLDIVKLKDKCISLHWEFMFTRSRHQTADMGEQGRLLTELAQLMDAGRIQSTLRTHLGPICAENMKKAHTLQESGKTIGKIVLEGFR